MVNDRGIDDDIEGGSGPCREVSRRPEVVDSGDQAATATPSATPRRRRVGTRVIINVRPASTNGNTGPPHTSCALPPEVHHTGKPTTKG
jgi:hypothetical protein